VLEKCFVCIKLFDILFCKNTVEKAALRIVDLSAVYKMCFLKLIGLSNASLQKSKLLV